MHVHYVCMLQWMLAYFSGSIACREDSPNACILSLNQRVKVNIARRDFGIYSKDNLILLVCEG